MAMFGLAAGLSILAPAGAGGTGIRPDMLPDTSRTITLAPAMPGAVITAAVDVPAEVRGRGTVRYVITVAPLVRLFGSYGGAFAGDRAPDRIPLTFTLPREQPAGGLQIASVRFARSDGVTFTTELRLEVSAVRRVRAIVAAASVASPSRPLVVHYRVVNLGNAGDTIAFRVGVPSGWRTARAPGTATVARGDTLAGSFAILVPRGAPAESYSVSFVAAGRADTSVANAFFQVGPDILSGGWATLPATVFFGFPTVVGGGNREPAFALVADGLAAPGTSMTLRLRHAPGTQSLAFHRYTSGPELLMSVRRPDWGLSAGEIFVSSASLLGVYATGIGAQYSWARSTTGDIYVARPSEYGSGMVAGHLLRGSLAVPTPAGDLGIRLADFERPLREGLTGNRSRMVSLTYEVGPSSDHLSIEGGYARIQADSGEMRTGPAVRAEYSLSYGSAFLVGRATRVPAVAPGNAAMNENYLGAGIPLFRGLQLVGWASRNTVPLIGLPATGHTDLSAGLRASAGLAALDLRANYNETEGLPVLFGGSFRQRSVSAMGGAPLGPFTLDLDGELGTIDLGAGRNAPLRNAMGHLSWRGPGRSAWFGVTRTEAQFGAMPTRLDFGGSAAYREFQLDGGAGAYLSPQAGHYLGHAWGAAAVPLLRGVGAALGAEYEPWMAPGSRVRLSLGLKADLGLPVPLPGRSSARGVVFEDRNGDGRRGEDEPLIPGVGLRLGTYATSTGLSGQFAFPSLPAQRVHRELQVDLGSLPVGWLVGDYLRTARRAEIPMIRAGALRIRLIVDETEQARTGLVAPPVAGTDIELVDAIDRRRTAVSDSTGTILFKALPPGAYTLTVYPVGARGQSLPPKVVPVQVPYGALRSMVIPIPIRPVEIRFTTPPLVSPTTPGAAKRR